MNSGFLEICNRDITEVDQHIYQGHLNLNHYKFVSKENLFSTVLEGVHQFACKTAELADITGAEEPSLPIQIDDYQLQVSSEPDAQSNVLLISSTVESMASFCVVKGKISNLKDKRVGSFQIKTASIPYVTNIDKEKELPHPLDDPDIYQFQSVIRRDEQAIELPFVFSEKSYLAYEHFPGAPILPASQIIGLARQACVEHFGMQLNQVCRSSFIQPVISGEPYVLAINQVAADKVKYSIQSGNTVHSRGLLLQSSSVGD